MPKLFLDMTVHLDGFIAGPNVSVKQPLGEGAINWNGLAMTLTGQVTNQTEILDINARVLDEASRSTGAVIMGKQTCDVYEGAVGGGPADSQAVLCALKKEETKDRQERRDQPHLRDRWNRKRA